MTLPGHFDVVIVGAGVAGGALATRLAREGMSVLILERTRVHVDRIRGEWLPPWGVQEAMRLGILDDLLAAGGHYVSKAPRYGDGVSIEAARAKPLNMAALMPGIPGAMTVGHPRLCDTLNQAARNAGATLLRGVSAVSVTPGLPPAIAFEHEGEHQSARPRLVVGADGRGSSIARQIGAKLHTDPVHHLIAGLLVDGVHSWPDDEQSVGVHNGINQLVFPQGDGRIRLYLCYSVEERGRFSGPHAARNFLEAFRAPTLPHSEEVAAGQIAGPCLGYPNADTWIDEPTAPGVVLAGDAAGHNDPTIGQGLSIAIRDVRLVAEALSNAGKWEIGTFTDYVSERRERMRRLRYTARLASKIRCEFGEEADRRRAEIARKTSKDPSVSLPTLPSLIGPFGVPDEAFEERAVKNLLGEDWMITTEGWPIQNTDSES